MLNALKQATASQAIKTNPVYDLSGSWVTNAAVADFLIAKNGGVLSALHTAAVVYDAGGCYTITLDATDTDTLGRVVIVCVKASTICRPKEFQVVPSSIYAALVDATAKLPVALAAGDVSGNLPANAKQWDGGALPTTFAASNLPSDYASHEDAEALAAAIATRASQATADAIKARTDLLGSGSVSVRSTVNVTGRVVRLVRGDDYLTAAGTAVRFTFAAGAVPDLTAAIAVQFSARSQEDDSLLISVAAVVVQAGAGTQIVDVELSHSVTQDLPAGDGVGWFDIEADFGDGGYRSLVTKGILNVDRDETRH